MEVESLKVDPSFSVRTAVPLSPLDCFAGGRSGFVGSGLERLTFAAATPPHGDAKMYAGPIPASACRRDRAAQGTVLKYGERLNSANFNLVKDA